MQGKTIRIPSSLRIPLLTGPLLPRKFARHGSGVRGGPSGVAGSHSGNHAGVRTTLRAFHLPAGRQTQARVLESETGLTEDRFAKVSHCHSP
jgi:hypothetical protein